VDDEIRTESVEPDAISDETVADFFEAEYGPPVTYPVGLAEDGVPRNYFELSAIRNGDAEPPLYLDTPKRACSSASNLAMKEFIGSWPQPGLATKIKHRPATVQAIAKVLLVAKARLRDDNVVLEWLEQKNSKLNDQRPIELMNSVAGCMRIELHFRQLKVP
jgi:hypothetical protein